MENRAVNACNLDGGKTTKKYCRVLMFAPDEKGDVYLGEEHCLEPKRLYPLFE